LSFFVELKRRHVFKVAIAYIVMAWLVIQVADVILNNIGAPDWVFYVILLVLGIGFLLALFLAWAYEITPDGIKAETDIEVSTSAIQHSSHTLDYIIIGTLLVAVIYLVAFKDQVDVDAQVSLETLIARPSVIVLPFANNSGDENLDYLAFGLTDELIAGLQRTRDLPVVSRNGSLEYADSNLSANEYAHSLGASYRVEGSISASDDGIRILATLSSAGDNQVWAERFQRVAGNAGLLDVADELVAKIVAAALQSEVQRVKRIDHPTADAWEHYIKGLAVVLDFDPDKYESARRHLDQAVELAPDMAEAWWAIGELEVTRYVSQPWLEEAGLEPLYAIIGYFRKSHELSPFHAAACGCLGYMLTAVGQPDEARAVYKQALEANPLSARLRIDYALFLLWDGRYDQAMENADLAVKLGIFGVDQAFVWLIRANVALARDNPSGALEAVNRAIFISDNPLIMPPAIALLYVLDKPAEAARLLAEMQQSYPGLSPWNPVVKVMLMEPINDILVRKRERGDGNVPADVKEIYLSLQKIEL
jgi:TolB-like protein